MNVAYLNLDILRLYRKSFHQNIKEGLKDGDKNFAEERLQPLIDFLN